MSIKINFTSVNPAVPAMINSYITYEEKPFFKAFGSGKAKIIGTDEDGYVDSSTNIDRLLLLR